MSGAGGRRKHKPLTPATAASVHHGAALARQRLKEQERIARENERMEMRLKVIREASPTVVAPHSYHRRQGGGGGGGRNKPAAVRIRKGGAPATDSNEDSSDNNVNDDDEADAIHNTAGRRQKESTAWRELYHEREALASAVEAAAAEAAAARARVGALRAKTLWTEANARRCDDHGGGPPGGAGGNRILARGTHADPREEKGRVE